MKYEDIYINDFGIFAKTSLLDLNPNFNIIGGANRAGKTTLLKLLRYIGYGIPKTDQIPPARNSYDLEAIINDDKARYSLLINGYAKPKINDLGDNEKEIENIFKNIDQFTYKQLFTITLDELKKIPAGVSDTEKLQSVLMGAGLKEYTLIPQLKEDFKSEAKDIAGKYGKINVGNFKEYNQIIEEGIELKKEAQKQVKEYYNLKDKLKDIKSEIDDKDKDQVNLRKEKNKLDLIKSNYNVIEELITLKNELNKEKYLQLPTDKKKFYPERAKELYESYKNIESNFKELQTDYNKFASRDYNEEIETDILNYNDKIDDYYNNISGLKERYNNILAKEKELEKRLQQIKKEGTSVSDYLSKNLEELLELETSIEFKNDLRKLVKEFEQVTTKIDNKKEEIEKLTRDIDSKENKKKELEQNKFAEKQNNIYLYSAIAGIILITYLSFINLRFLGLYLIDAFIFYKYWQGYTKKNEYEKQKEKIEVEINDLKRENIILEEELSDLKEIKNKINARFTEIKSSINLNEEIQPKLLQEYYEDILDLKNKYIGYNNMKKDLEQKKKSFNKEIKEIYNFLNKFADLLPFKEIEKDKIFNFVNEIINNLKTIYQVKELLQKLKKLRLEKTDIKEKLYGLEGMSLIDKNDRDLYVIVKDYQEKSELISLYNSNKERVKEIENQLANITEQTKEAFNINESLKKDEIISVFLKEYDKYISYQQVVEKFNTTGQKLNNILDELEQLKAKKEEIKLKMDNLATEDKLIKAENKINKARNNMKPLAERYAINNMSSYLLERYWQKFLKEKKDKLLNKASELMKKITSGEYKKIEPLESLTDPNFKVQGNKGKVFENVDYLSRGTREQLFMAIRINRIMEIEPTLPVIIDDSLVNFDPKHLRNIFDIINNLKNSNQIFFLTCHPEQIEFLDEKIDNKNYYSLEKGRFEKTDKKQLINTLS